MSIYGGYGNSYRLAIVTNDLLTRPILIVSPILLPRKLSDPDNAHGYKYTACFLLHEYGNAYPYPAVAEFSADCPSRLLSCLMRGA